MNKTKKKSHNFSISPNDSEVSIAKRYNRSATIKIEMASRKVLSHNENAFVVKSLLANHHNLEASKTAHSSVKTPNNFS